MNWADCSWKSTWGALAEWLARTLAWDSNVGAKACWASCARLSAADKTLALHDHLHGNQQFPPGLYFGHVTPRTQTECFPYHIRRGFLSQEDNSCVGRKLTDLPSRVESIQFWQPISRRIKSGCSASACWTASNPSPASPMTFKFFRSRSMEATNCRNGSLSSTTRIRTFPSSGLCFQLRTALCLDASDKETKCA